MSSNISGGGAAETQSKKRSIGNRIINFLQRQLEVNMREARLVNTTEAGECSELVANLFVWIGLSQKTGNGLSEAVVLPASGHETFGSLDLSTKDLGAERPRFEGNRVSHLWSFPQKN